MKRSRERIQASCTYRGYITDKRTLERTLLQVYETYYTLKKYNLWDCNHNRALLIQMIFCQFVCIEVSDIQVIFYRLQNS